MTLTPDQLEQKSRRARELLGDPVLREVVDALGRQYFEAWKIEPDAKKREELWFKFGALEETLGQLQAVASEWTVTAKMKHLKKT